MAVLFTDELQFCFTRGGRIRVYRQRNELYTEACTLERDRFGDGGSVMVWGSVSQHHRTELVVIAGNLNDFLQDRNCSAMASEEPGSQSY